MSIELDDFQCLTVERKRLARDEPGNDAGQALNMSRAMVSRHNASLESWLGVRLLHRTTRRVSLTDAGEEALARCRRLYELASEVRAAASNRQIAPSGCLQVAASSSIASTYLAPSLATFMNKHSNVRFELETHERRVDLVTERIDLAIRISNTIEPSLVARKLCDCRSVLCASPGYVQLCGTPQTTHKLAEHPCITHSQVAVDEYQPLLLRSVIDHLVTHFSGERASRDQALAGAN